MKKNFLLLFIIGAIFSCSKDNGGSLPPPPTPPLSSAEITAFSFDKLGSPAEGIINTEEYTIVVSLPKGVDRTKLVATFATTGASVKVGTTEQVSGTTPNDFTRPLTYVVTAEDGTTKYYTVTTSVQTETSKDIVGFYFVGFPDNAGTIDGTNITVNLPAGTDVTNLVAKFSHNGKSVTVGGIVQESGTTANDFTGSKNYVVTAEDETTNTYKVTVKKQTQTSKEITEFSFKDFPDAVTIFSGINISITLPEESIVTNLVVNFTITGASVKVGGTVQESGTTANDFTNPVNYVVTAEDGTTKTYKVTVSKQTQTSKEITSFSFKDFPDAVAIISGTNINLAVPTVADISNLVANFTITGASVKVGGIVQVSGTTANDFINPVNYVVTAKDGTTKTYKVTVALQTTTSKEITSFSLFSGTTLVSSGAVIDQTARTIIVSIETLTNLNGLTAQFSTTGASVKVNGTEQVSETTSNNFSRAVKYLVSAQNNSTKEYKVTVTIRNFAATGRLPQGIVVDAAGNIYTANYTDDNVTKITPAGVSSIFATVGDAPVCIAIDAAGNLYTANANSRNVSKITPTGESTILGSTGAGPWGIAVDTAGNVYTANTASSSVSKITPDGDTTNISTRAYPHGITVDNAGNVYTATDDADPGFVSKISPAGEGTPDFARGGSTPIGIAVDAAGNIYTANRDGSNISKITPAGVVTTPFASVGKPYNMTIDAAGNLYTANYDNGNASKITPAGVSAVIGTTGTNPWDIAIGPNGYVYTSNAGSNTVSLIVTE